MIIGREYKFGGSRVECGSCTLNCLFLLLGGFSIRISEPFTMKWYSGWICAWFHVILFWNWIHVLFDELSSLILLMSPLLHNSKPPLVRAFSPKPQLALLMQNTSVASLFTFGFSLPSMCYWYITTVVNVKCHPCVSDTDDWCCYSLPATQISPTLHYQYHTVLVSLIGWLWNHPPFTVLILLKLCPRRPLFIPIFYPTPSLLHSISRLSLPFCALLYSLSSHAPSPCPRAVL